MDALTTVTMAAVRAAHWHSTQRRKGAAGEPYINHLLEVAAMVAEATAGEDVNLVVAALLHDAIEDQQISPTTIADEFGEDVAALVMEATHDKSLPKEQRTQLQVEHAREVSHHAAARAAASRLAPSALVGTMNFGSADLRHLPWEGIARRPPAPPQRSELRHDPGIPRGCRGLHGLANDLPDAPHHSIPQNGGSPDNSARGLSPATAPSRRRQQTSACDNTVRAAGSVVIAAVVVPIMLW